MSLQQSAFCDQMEQETALWLNSPQSLQMSVIFPVFSSSSCPF